MAQSERMLTDGITVIKESVSAVQQVVRIRNDKDFPVRVGIDITGSTGVTIEQSGGASTFERVIPEKQTVVLATLSLQGDWNVVAKYNCSKRLPEDPQQRQQMSELLASCSTLCKSVSLQELSSAHLRERGIGNFADPYFPPGSDAIYCGAESMQLKTSVQWRRPNQFFGEQYSVFFEDIEPNDIQQGQLGDCWLMCALSALAERPQLVRRLFISEDPAAGIYRLRICKDGEWQIVTVDDYFPCIPNRGPIFSHAHGNELWVLLLEKAYAKLVGSYLLLRGGWANEGMSDLTGCPTTTYEFELTEDKEALWRTITAADDHGALIAAATPGQDLWTETKGPDRAGGLVPGHAYTVISAKEARGNRLLNIRNPWGTFEWDGDWNDKSPLWTAEMKSLLKPILDQNDGTFWMSYQDFLKSFVSVSLCFPEQFYEARLKGKFVRVNMRDGRGAVLSKFYYCLALQERSRVFFGLHQEDRRTVGVNEKRAYLDLGLLVFRKNRGANPTLVHCEPMKVDRQLEVEMNLDPGEYLIVPRTSGCALRRPPNAKPEGKPILINGHLSPAAQSTFKDIFRKFDMMVSGDLSELELRAVYESGGLRLTSEEFAAIKARVSSTREGITKEGFLELMEQMALSKTEDYMWGFLENLGYDRDFYSVRSRVFMLTIHSKSQVSLEMRDNLESNLTNLGLVEHLKAKGQKRQETDLATLYSLGETYYEHVIRTYMFLNKSQQPIKVLLDVTGCQNVALSTMMEVNTMTLEREAGGVLLHFMALPGGEFVFRPRIEITAA